MKQRSAILTLVCVVIAAILLLVLTLQQVPAPTAENTRVVSGILQSFRETEQEDLAIELQGDEHYYYVNRFRGAGLDLGKLKQSLSPGDRVQVTFIEKGWSPLDPFGSMRPVAALASGKEVFFDRVQR